MTWAAWIASELTPAFGGFPTFVLDPDDLLEEPEVREAFMALGVAVEQWSGQAADLDRWSTVEDSDRPVVRVPAGVPLHAIRERLSSVVLLDISIAKVFRKIDPEIVGLIERDRWQTLFLLQEFERPLRTRHDSAEVVARAVFGLDPLYGAMNGWQDAIDRVARTGITIPAALIEEIVPPAEVEVCKALSDLAVARKHSTDGSQSFARPSTTEKRRAYGEARKRGASLAKAFDDPKLAAHGLLKLAMQYGEACADGLDPDLKVRCNQGFLKWLRSNYDLALTSHNPDVLRLHSLVRQYVRPTGKTMLVVVDALGVEAWAAAKNVWLERRGLHVGSAKAAFAMIPTVTHISRRAIFEGVLPPQNSSPMHSPKLERELWANLVPSGRYFSVAERDGLLDAMWQGKTIAVVDVTWDKRGHAIDPATESIAEAATQWAMRCAIADVMRQAVEIGYRVVLTADHGQAAGKGIGVPNLGAAIDDRSKRYLQLGSKAALHAVCKMGISDFRPISVSPDAHPLFANAMECFDIIGTESVSHGGVTLEEVIVPVVEVVA